MAISKIPPRKDSTLARRLSKVEFWGGEEISTSHRSRDSRKDNIILLPLLLWEVESEFKRLRIPTTSMLSEIVIVVVFVLVDVVVVVVVVVVAKVGQSLFRTADFKAGSERRTFRQTLETSWLSNICCFGLLSSPLFELFVSEYSTSSRCIVARICTASL